MRRQKVLSIPSTSRDDKGLVIFNPEVGRGMVGGRELRGGQKYLEICFRGFEKSLHFF